MPGLPFREGFKFKKWASALAAGIVLAVAAQAGAQELEQAPDPKPRLVTLNFNDVDLPVFVKFISELTSKNFVVDEQVKGKVTIFSPSKITAEQAYEIFLSVLESKGFTAIPIQDAIHILPSNQVPTEQSVNVYYLENANAEEMVKVLSGLVGVPTPASARRRAVRTAGEFEGPVRLFADKATNALVVMASPSDYMALKEIIQKLDVKRRQVYVEAVIMEIGMDKLREIGVEIQGPIQTDSDGNLKDVFQSVGGTNFGGIQTFATQGPTGLTGLAIGVVKGTFTFRGQEFLNVGALLRALQSDAEIDILSTPQILTSDNQKAEIVVGENRPFVTGQSQTVGGNVLTTIERRDVGITLRLTPQIMESNRIRMDLFQEISTISESVSQTVGDTVVGPTTNKRSASTTIVVNDKQTVVVGGLMRDNITRSVRKIPLLGDIPILGWLFKFKSTRTEKTNLLIFLTPYVVQGTAEVAQIGEDKARQMRAVLEREKVTPREPVEDALRRLYPATEPLPQETPE